MLKASVDILISAEESNVPITLLAPAATKSRLVTLYST